MAEWFSNFFAWMEALPPLWAYVTLFVVAYGENVIPPIPGDMVVVFGGYMAGVGLLDLGVVVTLSTVGGALGFLSMYAIGRRLGTAVRDPDRFRWLPQDGFDRAEQWLQQYGFGVVVANRFLSGARSVISLTVGMARMSVWQTALWCTVSAAVWCGLISYAGYAVGDNWRIIGDYLQAYGRIVIGLLAVVGLVVLARWGWNRHASTADESDGPTPPGDLGARRGT